MSGTSEKIRRLCELEGISINQLAGRLDSSRQNLNNKLRRDNFQESELEIIAKVLNCTFESYFVTKDGTKI